MDCSVAAACRCLSRGGGGGGGGVREGVVDCERGEGAVDHQKGGRGRGP